MESKIFAKKTLADCSLVLPKYAMPPNFANSHKTSKFVEVFSLESFTLYGINWDSDVVSSLKMASLVLRHPLFHSLVDIHNPGKTHSGRVTLIM